MFNFFAGTLFGIIVSSVGFSALASIADSGVHKVQQVTKQAVK
jgi:hypothetical protein